MIWPFSGRRSAGMRLGVLGMSNRRGLGTETRNFASIVQTALPEIRLDVRRLPTGRKAQDILDRAESDGALLRWIARQDAVLSFELFSPALLRACKARGVRSIWRPNHEWISSQVAPSAYAGFDHILAPQHACAHLLRETLGLRNVVTIPWILDAPVEVKGPQPGTVCRFLFNAGHGGVGDRRNTAAVVAGFAQALASGAPVHLTIKTQVALDTRALQPYAGSGFTYIQRKATYAANLDTYRRADFSLAPSKWEGVGFALLESLHCGTPVVTVDAPPMNEWVAHGRTGWLLPTRFPDLPIPLPAGTPAELGLNYVPAALCEPADLAAAVIALATQRATFYEQFAAENRASLEARRSAFVATLRDVLLGTGAGSA